MSSRNFMRVSSKALFQRLGSKKSYHAAQPWRIEADKKVLETTGLTFRLKFLGMRVVNGSMDVTGCVQALRELDLSSTEGKYRVLLTLSPVRVHLVQYPWKLACDHSTKDISYCCSDPQNPRLFAYITKQRNTSTHICICLKTISNTEITGKSLVDAFTHAFSCHKNYKSITSFSSLKSVGDTDQIEDSTSCVKGLRFKGLPHYHTQLFNDYGVTSKRSKMIKEQSKLTASETSLTHKQVPCAPSCSSNMANEAHSTRLSAEKSPATGVHGVSEYHSVKNEIESIGQSTVQGTSTFEEKNTQKTKEVPRLLPRLKVRSYPPPPPPASQMNDQFQTHSKLSKQPVHQKDVAIQCDTPLSLNVTIPKEHESVPSHGSHKPLCTPSTNHFSCSFEQFGATFTVPLIVAFSILNQLSSS